MLTCRRSEHASGTGGGPQEESQVIGVGSHLHVQEQSSEPAGDLWWAKAMRVGHRPCHTKVRRLTLTAEAAIICGDSGSWLCL